MTQIYIREENQSMCNPPSVGSVIKELYLEPYNISIAKFSRLVGINRAYASKVINGKAGVSIVMSLRLAKLFNTTAELWIDMQKDVDLWEAKNTTDTSSIPDFRDVIKGRVVA